MYGMFVSPFDHTHAYQECFAGAGRKDIKLVSVSLAGKQLSSGQYQVTDKHLVIETLPKGDFDLEVEVDVKPKENTSLEGLYNSSGTFCTQCEAEGFRGITYFYDRSVFVVMITIMILLCAAARPFKVCSDNKNCLQAE
jgi:aminopeptidase N